MALKSPEGSLFANEPQKQSDTWPTSFKKSVQGLVDLLRRRGGTNKMPQVSGRPNIDFCVITSVAEDDEVRSILLYSSGLLVSLSGEAQEVIYEVESMDPYDFMDYYAAFKYPNEIFEKTEAEDAIIESADEVVSEDERLVGGLGGAMEKFVEENKEKLKKELQEDFNNAFRKAYGVIN